MFLPLLEDLQRIGERRVFFDEGPAAVGMCGKDGGLAFICALLVGARQGGAQRLERQFGEGGVGGIGEFVADFLEGEAVVGRFLQDIVDMFCKVAGAGCAGRCLCAQGGEGLCGG